MLDPASSVEMVKVLEEDPMVGGVGGDVQVHVASLFLYTTALIALTYRFIQCLLAQCSMVLVLDTCKIFLFDLK